MSIRKGDLVEVISGDDRGRQGKVMSVDTSKGLVQVEGINMIKRHTKPHGAKNPGGIIERPAFVSRSNVILVCPKCGKAAKTKRERREKKHVRVCKNCGGEIES